MDSRAFNGLRNEWLAVAFVEGFDPKRNPEIQNLEQFRVSRASADRVRLNQEQITNDRWLQRTNPETRKGEDTLPVFMLADIMSGRMEEMHNEFLRIADETQRKLDDSFAELDRQEALLHQQEQELLERAITLPDGRKVLIGRNGEFYEYETGDQLTGADRERARAIRDSNPNRRWSTVEEGKDLNDRWVKIRIQRERVLEQQRELDRLRAEEERLRRTGGSEQELKELRDQMQHLQDQTGETNNDIRQGALQGRQEMAKMEATERQGMPFATSGIIASNVNPTFNSVAEGTGIGEIAPSIEPSKTPQTPQNTYNLDL